jgi:hypothetical protein
LQRLLSPARTKNCQLFHFVIMHSLTHCCCCESGRLSLSSPAEANALRERQLRARPYNIWKLPDGHEISF